MKLKYKFKDLTIKVGDWVTFKDNGWQVGSNPIPCYRVREVLDKHIKIIFNDSAYDTAFNKENLVKIELGQKGYLYKN